MSAVRFSVVHTIHMFLAVVAPAPSGRDPEATGGKSEEESLRSQDERQDQVTLGKTKEDKRPGDWLPDRGRGG